MEIYVSKLLEVLEETTPSDVLYPLGVYPVYFLNVLQNVVLSLNFSNSAMSKTFKSVVNSNFFASEIRKSITYFVIDLLVSFLNKCEA